MDIELEAIRDLRGRPQLPRAGSDTTMVTTGYLIAGPGATRRCTVSVYGSGQISGVIAASADYTGATTVRILMDRGRPVQVLGPAGVVPVGQGGASGQTTPVIPPPPPPITPATVTSTRVILPTGSGTWRAMRGAWGRWGVAADTAQGNADGSGPLTGLACYGDQIVALGATTILKATLTLVQNPDSGFSTPWPAVVQGSPHGALPAGAPTAAGTTTTVTMPGRGRGSTATADLPADVRNALRTGSVKGLALTGSTYGSALGAGRHGLAWALTLEYQTIR